MFHPFLSYTNYKEIRRILEKLFHKKGKNMLNQFFTVPTSDITIVEFLICTFASLLSGVMVALIHMYKNSYSKNFILTLIILPVIVQAVIMLVNGNLGTGVAVMGAFSLIRFRSAEGNSREITSLFLSTAIGLAIGIGQIGVAGLMLLAVGAAILLMQALPFGSSGDTARELTVSVPEDLDYEGLFDDLFSAYTKSFMLVKVTAHNAGEPFELQYHVTLKTNTSTQKFLEEIRSRNQNLPVMLYYLPSNKIVL